MPVTAPLLDASRTRRALSGFLLSGILFSFLGAILPKWGYHLTADYTVVGNYFLSLNLGILLSIGLARAFLPKYGIRASLVFSGLLAFSSLLFLSFTISPASPWWRSLGLLGVGSSAGLLNTAVFHAISGVYRHSPASTVNLAGVLFGSGCLLTAVLVAGTFYVYTVWSVLFLLAMAPALFTLTASRWSFPRQPPAEQPSLRQAFRDFRSAGAVLFTVLLFFQFGNEWAIAGWLPLYLVQKLGVSPVSSLWMLSLYWLALLVGRVAAQAALARLSHARLLLASVIAAMFGCLILMFTDNLFGVASGLVIVGSGFAAIYPLVVEMIGNRFPYYHPGFFNGIFSFALTGGLLAPWTLGFLTNRWGISVVMVLPLAGSVLVFLLVLLIWLGSKLSGPATSQPDNQPTS